MARLFFIIRIYLKIQIPFQFFNFILALVLNLLKDFFERSGKSFNKFRTSAKEIRLQK